MSGGDRDGSARDQVLAFMKDRKRPGSEASRAARATARSVKRPRSSFEDLAEMKAIRAQETAGRQLQIDNPFNRVHDTAAGATTMIDGRELINFASYDYLGLNTHPKVRAATRDAIDRFGVSASASRLVAGERTPHRTLEAALAENYGVEDAVVFVSGYLTNATTIDTLLGPEDVIFHDEFIHNSALTGARLSGAARRSFKHNDLADLERLLDGLDGRFRRILVIVEGVYSMDGDIADLPGLIELRARYGFWLMVDEAHALGVLGKTGRGSFEHWGCNPSDIDLWMGTLSKTTASCGGYIAGSATLATLLKGAAGGFVYSVGLAPALAEAAIASLAVMREEPERVEKLRANGRHFLALAAKAGLDTGDSGDTAVIPVLVRDSIRAAQLSNDLLAAGLNVLPIIHPAVPEGLARLRFFLTSDHTEAQIETAVELTRTHLQRLVENGFGLASIDMSAMLGALART